MEFSLRLVFMLLYTPAAMTVSLGRPFWGLLMLVFLYYFRPEIWGAPEWFRPILWITISVGIGWAVKVRSFRFHPLMGVSLIVLLATLAGALTANSSTDAALDATWVLTKLLIVMFLTMQLVDTPKKINQFLWANVVGMLWNLKTILVVGARGGDLERVNVAVGQGGGANYLAWVLVMMLAFLFTRFSSGSKKERTFIFALFPLYVLGAVFTGSRGGILQLFAVMTYLVLRSNRKVLGLTAGVLVAAILIVALPDAQWARLKRGVGPEEQRDFSAQSRVLLWRAAWTMFRESPVLGKGIDNYPLLSPRYAGFFAGKSPRPYEPGATGRGFVAHSTWFQTLAEGGIAVSLPFFALFPMAFLAMWQTRRLPYDRRLRRRFVDMAVAMEGILIATIIASTFGSHMKIDFLWWFFGLFAAIHLTAEDAVVRSQAARQAEITYRRRNAWRKRAGLDEVSPQHETVGG
ncbi:MAG: hypothetical protein CMJ83_14300 [Planctomycetes bacterium]|nr:hypothetical protein [Planctomycetota bacterium]